MQTLNARSGSVRLLCWVAALSLGDSVATASPGEHVRAGNAEITPSVEVLGVYRTNVFLQEGIVSGGDPVTAGSAVQVRPTLGIKIDSDEAEFGLNAGYTARKYFSTELSNLDRFKDLDFGARLNALPQSIVGLRLNDRFFLSGRETEAVTAADAYITHLRNRGRGSLVVRPGSSLEVDLGGSFEYDDYQVPDTLTSASTSNLNSRLGYGPLAELKWRFFPKTAVVAEYEMYWYSWENNFIDARGDVANDPTIGDFIGVPDSSGWRVQGGLRGRFTEKIVLGLLGGYGKATYDEASVVADAANEPAAGGTEVDGASQGFSTDVAEFPDALLLTAELGYMPNENHKFSLTYGKDFQDVYFTNYVAFHNISSSYEGRFGDRFIIQPQFIYRLEDYRGEVTRDDQLIRARFDLKVQAASFMQVGLGTWFTRRISPDVPEMEYDDVNVHAGLLFSY